MDKFFTFCSVCILSICCSNSVFAQGRYDSGAYGASLGEAQAYWGLSGFTSTDEYRQGFEASLTVWKQYAGYRLSGVIYGAQNLTDEYENRSYSGAAYNDVYLGYSGTALWGVGDIVKPYLGLGVFVGQNNSGCHDNAYASDSRNRVYYSNANNPDSRCDPDDYLFSFFPEVGIALTLENLQVTPFVRFYVDTETHRDDVHTSYGLILAFEF